MWKLTPTDGIPKIRKKAVPTNATHFMNNWKKNPTLVRESSQRTQEREYTFYVFKGSILTLW